MKHRVIGFWAVCLLVWLLLPVSKVSLEESIVDFAGEVKLDLGSETLKQAVSVKTFVDGDTTHFIVPESVHPSGVLKARFLACNTPESTGKIEEWGKKASSFTREKLESAEEILVESDTDQWNMDSTSTRCLVWVWYRPAGAEDFRNLNIELLQNGLAAANSSAQNRYGETCMAAIQQAKAQKLNIYSGEKDPDFFYGDAIALTIRELRLHPEEYEGKKVAFQGVITMNYNNAVFIESFDEESELYFGITAYYGFNMSGRGLDILSVGNEVKIVGTMQYYEAGQAWQVSGMTYRMMQPDDPDNILCLSEGNSPSWKETTAEMLLSQVTLPEEDGTKDYDYAFLALNTSVEMKGLRVQSVAPDLKEQEETGANLLSCVSEDGKEVSVFVYPIKKDGGGNLTDQDFLNKTIDVRGIVEFKDGYRVCVFTKRGLTIQD